MRVLIFLFLTAAGLLPAQDLSTLDQMMKTTLSRQKIPGLAVAAVKDGRVVYAKGFGVLSVEAPAAVTADSLFRVGSTTKVMVAAAVLKLAEQGRLRLDAPVGNYIVGLDPKIAQLTAHQLLSHTAGLIEEVKTNGPHDDENLARNVSSWTGSLLFTEPGKVFSYSNLGYVLAGRLIEVVKGEPFADVMDELVFQPLGMKSTTFRPTLAMTYTLAQGHSAGKVVRPLADHAGYWPAGSMFTSANDFARFVAAFLNGGKIGDEELLSPWLVDALSQSRAIIRGPEPTEYAYGLEILNGEDTRFFRHSGARVGYTSAVVMAPEFKTGVIVLANRDGVDPAVLAQRIVERILPVIFVPLAEPAPVPPPDLSKYAGKYSNGAQSLEIGSSEGKLTADTGSGEAVPLEPWGPDCFKKDAVSVCFSEGYAHLGDRSLLKQ